MRQLTQRAAIKKKMSVVYRDPRMPQIGLTRFIAVEGVPCLTPDCATHREIDEWVRRAHAELEKASRAAHRHLNRILAKERTRQP